MPTPNATAKAVTHPVRRRTRRMPAGQPAPVAIQRTSTAEQCGHLGGRGLALGWLDPRELLPYERNPRTHSKKQIEQIAASIREFGFTNPVLIDGERRIIAGHGRVAAAKLLGMDRVPTVRLEHLSEVQKRAYIIADNRLAELAGWDETLLAIELKYLTEFDFSVELTGFVTAEIDLVIGRQEQQAKPDPADDVVEPDRSRPSVVRPGDLWLLGQHRLLCGDARDPACFATLMDGKQARMVFTDPPYNVKVDGHVCGLGGITHADFAMASGEMSEAEFTGFLKTVFANLAQSSLNGALHYLCMDWRHQLELLTAARDVYAEMKNLCVWNKTNGGMGSLYRSKHELVFVFKVGKAPHINNIELGRYGRYRCNVWDYAGVNTFKTDRMDELSSHPTCKPVALVADAIRDCTRRSDVVLDAFGGSGTTLIAAERTGRFGYALELDPGYVEVAIKRWEKLTGKPAVHAGSGLTRTALAAACGIAGDGSSGGEENLVDAEVGHG
jgi:DNA modification methylase